MVGAAPLKRVVNPSSLMVLKVAFQNPKIINLMFEY